MIEPVVLQPGEDVGLRNCVKCGNILPVGAQFCSKCGDRQLSLTQRLQEALGNEYELMAELGRGGSAVVYSVLDKPNRRYLAVKAMRPELLASPVVVERFRREAEYVSHLDHPNICSVVFSGEKLGLFYYAMPRIRGKPLSKHLEGDKQMPLPTVLNILGQIASGLYHAHGHGVVHRDIKPSNIMVEDDGHVHILDFGVAKALSADGGSLSMSGEILGSPLYMSPEQAGGSKSIDHRADIYSWGVLAYHMVAGRVPFDDERIQAVLYQQMSTPAPDLGKLRPDAPQQLVTTIHRCMEKTPAKRWGNIREAALEAGCSI